jgi:hypothetical protein
MPVFVIPNLRADSYLRVDSYGNKRWFKEGTDTLHREDGPAYEDIIGNKQWFLNGMRHRVDGPAVVYSDGSSGGYYLNNVCYSQLEHRRLTKYAGRIFKKEFIKCRGCGNKYEWTFGTSKRSYVCLQCRSL